MLVELAAELVDEQAAVGEDQHAFGACRLDEAGGRDRLARRRSGGGSGSGARRPGREPRSAASGSSASASVVALEREVVVVLVLLVDRLLGGGSPVRAPLPFSTCFSLAAISSVSMPASASTWWRRSSVPEARWGGFSESTRSSPSISPNRTFHSLEGVERPASISASAASRACRSAVPGRVRCRRPRRGAGRARRPRLPPEGPRPRMPSDASENVGDGVSVSCMAATRTSCRLYRSTRRNPRREPHSTGYRHSDMRGSCTAAPAPSHARRLQLGRGLGAVCLERETGVATHDGLDRLDPDAARARRGTRPTAPGSSLLMLGPPGSRGSMARRAAARWRESFAQRRRPRGAADRRDQGVAPGRRDEGRRRPPRWALELGSEDADSPIGRYAAALALLVLERDGRAGELAAGVEAEATFPAAVADALRASLPGDGPSSAAARRGGARLVRARATTTSRTCRRRHRARARGARGAPRDRRSRSGPRRCCRRERGPRAPGVARAQSPPRPAAAGSQYTSIGASPSRSRLAGDTSSTARRERARRAPAPCRRP